MVSRRLFILSLSHADSTDADGMSQRVQTPAAICSRLT
jgi:hypothetical protein